MSENIGVATGKIMLKIVIALFKGVWNLELTKVTGTKKTPKCVNS